MRSGGNLHQVKCHGCGLKMACSCWTVKGKPHIIILCPKCQVEEFTDMLCGGAGGPEESESESARPAEIKLR